MKEPRRRLEVNLEELDRVLDGARQAPLSDQDHHKLREALHAMAAMLVQPRTTEKTSSVVGKPEDAASDTAKQSDPNELPIPSARMAGSPVRPKTAAASRNFMTFSGPAHSVPIQRRQTSPLR